MNVFFTVYNNSDDVTFLWLILTITLFRTLFDWAIIAFARMLVMCEFKPKSDLMDFNFTLSINQIDFQIELDNPNAIFSLDQETRCVVFTVDLLLLQLQMVPDSGLQCGSQDRRVSDSLLIKKGLKCEEIAQLGLSLHQPKHSDGYQDVHGKICPPELR